MSFLPPKFARCSFDNFEATTPNARRALVAARRFAAGEIRNLVFTGPTGVGKTHLAAAALSEWWVRESERWQDLYDARMADPSVPPFEKKPRRPIAPEWISVSIMLTDLRTEIGRPGVIHPSPASRLYELRDHRAPVLLDDLGRENVTDWTGEIIHALINARYEQELPTIVTTNITRVDIGNSIYWPAISRLAQDGVLVDLVDKDHRLG